MTAPTVAERVSVIVLLILLAGASATLLAADAANPKPPRTDIYDRFDDAQSPLQKAMLDARDGRWRGKAKLGSDPRCGRVVRELAREEGKPSPSQPHLCFDEQGEALPQDRCINLYCCGSADASCPESACGQALIAGEDLGSCFATGEVPDACVEKIFKKGAQPRVVECLDNPLDDAGEVLSKCRPLFDACPTLPFLKSEKDAARSGVIRDSDNRETGRRIQSRTVIHYDASGQRGRNHQAEQAGIGWDPIRIQPSRPEAKAQAVPGAALSSGSLLSAATFQPGCDPLFRCLANDDGDCMDRASGRSYGPAECFDADGRLRPTLSLTSDNCPPGSVCCRHTGLGAADGSGELFLDDDCLIDPSLPAEAGNLRTSLMQKIDEDPFDALNNDGDCANGAIVTSDCLDAAGGLRAGFHWSVDEEACDGVNNDNDCLATGGRIGTLSEARCLDSQGAVLGAARNVDFIDLIDEDCPESTAGVDTVDNDGDGLFGEDPPGTAASMSPAGTGSPSADELACRSFYAQVGSQAGVPLAPEESELPTGAAGCDLTRAERVYVNWSLHRPDNLALLEEFRRRSGRDKVFDVDAHGRWCGAPGSDPCADETAHRGAVHPDNLHDPRNASGHGKSYGYEERQVILDEVFTVKCKPFRDKSSHAWVETRYDEATGTCVQKEDATVAASRRAGAPGVAGETCEGPACRQALMGFTFAPPVLEWGWRSQERVCVFGICFEIFYARIGYEFDLAAGVRLPVEVQFEGVPDSILATEALPTIETSLQPLDFSTDQFRAFCRMHGLDHPWYISDCDRFAFPDFLDPTDGDELVARYSIFAGVIVRLLMIPLINYGIDSGVDVPAMCTSFKMMDGIEGMNLADLTRIQLGLLQDSDALRTLKENLGNCGSFTTPFGFEPCDPADPTSCPPAGKKLRGWPFLNFSKWIRADCFDAVLHGETVTVRGRTIPICTGLVLGTAGASLGVGLGVEANAGSLLIKAGWSGQGDTDASGGTLSFETSVDDPTPGDRACHVPVRGVTADNLAEFEADGHYEDHAVVALDDFTYYLNAMELTLNAKLEFGGILSPIPDIASFKLYSFVFDTSRIGWDGIPIPQHPGTRPVEVKIPVENYGLALDVAPGLPQATRPGCVTGAGAGERCPDYAVGVTNLGSFSDSFDNFRFELSNRPDLTGCPRSLRLDPNNDGDCVIDGVRYRGNPFDTVPDDCYDACGLPLPGAEQLSDEDPPGCAGSGSCRSLEDMDDDRDGFMDEDGPEDAWSAVWLRGGQPVSLPEVADVPAHTGQDDALQLRISPLAHPFSRPGVYPFRLKADSEQSKLKGLPAVDPLGNQRVDAAIEGTLQVTAFFDPRIALLPDGVAAMPGNARTFRVDAANGANTPDSMTIATRFLDSNSAPCGIATRGGGEAGCPYRAEITAVPPEWLEGAPPQWFGPLQPSQIGTASFTIRVPATWAGMEDTLYGIEMTATSTGDPGSQPASRTVRIEQMVRTTLESKTRYIGLEIQELIEEIGQAQAAGLRTAGLLAIATHPIQLAHARAMERLAANDPGAVIQALQTTRRTTGAFLRALNGSGGNLPPATFGDWRMRAGAILDDLAITVERSVYEPLEPVP